MSCRYSVGSINHMMMPKGAAQRKCIINPWEKEKKKKKEGEKENL